jgi:hypothetical protein
MTIDTHLSENEKTKSAAFAKKVWFQAIIDSEPHLRSCQKML